LKKARLYREIKCQRISAHGKGDKIILMSEQLKNRQKRSGTMLVDPRKDVNQSLFARLEGQNKLILDEASFSVNPVPLQHRIERIVEAIVVNDTVHILSIVLGVVQGIKKPDGKTVEDKRRKVKWHGEEGLLARHQHLCSLY